MEVVRSSLPAIYFFSELNAICSTAGFCTFVAMPFATGCVEATARLRFTCRRKVVVENFFGNDLGCRGQPDSLPDMDRRLAGTWCKFFGL